jgi:SpoVK/Ycf46/Vps4 family AAA+-type ATPase
MPQPYRDSTEHLFAELKRLDLMLRRAVLIARETRSADVPDEFRGLVISEESVAHILDTVDFLSDTWRLEPALSRTAAAIDAQLEQRQQDIRARMEASASIGEQLTLPRLAATFNLSPAEVDVLLVALAPELEPRYETLYAYIQNDVTRKRPSLDLCLNLVCRNAQEKIQARQLFSDDSPLVHYRLVELREESYDRSPTRLRHFLRLSDTVTRFLLEQQPRQTGSARLINPASGLDELETSDATRNELRALANSIRDNGTAHALVQLWGPGEAPLQQAAVALGNQLDKTTLYAELADIAADEGAPLTLIRDTLLWDNLLVVSRGHAASLETERARLSQVQETLLTGIIETNLPMVMLSQSEQFGSVAGSTHLWRIRIDGPDYDTRRKAWANAVGPAIAADDIERLADTFSFSGERLEQTVGLARARAALRNPANPQLAVADVLAAGRDLTNPNISQFAIPIEPRFGWDDLVLPPDEMQQLRGVADRLLYRNLVLRDWQFGSKLSRGRGLAVLFTGTAGSGKTMAAEVLARELSLRMLQIDLATVVSKYIGETECNLSLIFREAEMSQSLLFFDEADALYGKRTEVNDAHDHYANLQVNYLLQRIEQYEGLVVLATNFQENIDDAFLRRLHCVVRFPFPDVPAREQIWKQQFPDSAPLAEKLDYAFLASQFKLSGGNIRNAALEAAFLAAHEHGAQGRISMQHLVEAVKREYQKQGKLVMKTDLGRYWRSA